MSRSWSPHGPWSAVLWTVVVAFNSAACKPKAGVAASSGQVLPQLVAGTGDATAATKVGVYGKGGGSKLILDLVRTPPAGSPNIWTCWGVPPSTFVLGNAVCQGDGTKTVALTAANVDMFCSVNPGLGTTATATPLSLAACPAYDIFLNPFNPPLSLAVSTN